MAQILKYSGGGTSPKPIKIGSKYYTKELLMTDLYGDKLDEYIKFREFNSKEAANFRKNLDNQVNALIDGRLTLNGNTLIDSKGEWSNTGEYAKPKLFGKLNEEQIKNNESLDVANYLIRALNSNKIATYTAPSEYNLFESDAFKTYNDMLEDTDWLNEDVTKRRNRIAQSLEDEANKLEKDSNYQGKYSYEGWQDVDWDTRANATILKLKDAAKTLKDSTINGLDLKLKLGLLGYGDLANYLEKEEVPAENLSNSGSQNENGNSNGSGNDGNQSGQQKDVTHISNGFNPVDPFNFADPILYYNGTPYTYGTPEYLNLLKDRNNLYNEEMSLLDYVTSEINLLGKIDRNFATFLSVPEYYKYYSNVTPNFKESTNIKAAYLLRPDALSSKGSILRIVDNNNRINDYIIDANKGRLYLTDQDKTGLYKKRIVGGKELFKAFSDNGIVLNRLESPSLDLGEGIGTTNEIFRSIEANNPTPLKYIEQLVNYIDNNKELINKHGSGSLRGQYLGSINKILGLNRRGKIKNIVTYSSDKKTIEINVGGKTLYIKLKTPHNDVSRDIHINNVDKIYVNKDGGILKAQAGIKTLKLTSTSTTSEELPENQLSTSLRGKKTLSKATNAALEATSKEGAFSSTDSARLNLALLDVGSAVAGVLPGLSAVSAVTGAASSVGTAIADYVDVYNNKMGFWDATKNLGMSLGLDAVSLLPGMKSLKVAKGLKVIAHILPRAMGFFWAKGLITDENQKKALLETGTKLSNGDFSKLNTLDFLNIATLIRMTTLGARDAHTVRKKVFGSGKKENVVISGKVEGTPVFKTIEGDAAKNDLGRRFWGMNPKYKAKAKKALTDEANSNPNTRQTDVNDKQINWTERDIKDFKIETKPAEVEIDGPKAILENFLGLGNKGFNVPYISDKWIAQRWFPKYHYGMVSKEDVNEMRTNPLNDKYDDLDTYFRKDSNGKPISDRLIRNMMNDGTYDNRLNAAKRAEKKRDLEAGRVDVSKVSMQDVNEYAHEIISLARNYNRFSTKKSSELILEALNKLKGNEKFDLLQFKKDLLWGINTSLNTVLYGYLDFDNFGRVVQMDKQGGRIELGLLLIKAYKSGGLVIPKFEKGKEVTLKYQYDPNKYYIDDIANYNTTTLSGNQLTDIWAKKGTSSTSGNKEGIYTAKTLLNNITHLQGLDYLKNEYIASDKWVKAVQNYAQTHGVDEYNNLISHLRSLRALFEGQKHLYKDKSVAEYNSQFNDIFGPDYHAYSDELKGIYGQATNLRHVLSFTSTKEKEDQRKFNINGKDYWLDNAGYLRTGEYGKLYVSNQDTSTSEAPGTTQTGNPSNTNTDKTDKGTGGETVTGGDETVTGSTQYTSNQFKTKTRPNPIQLLRMAELAGALGTNAAATNELLKYRSYSLDAPYKLAYLYDKYPLIAATQNQVGMLNTQTSIPTTADLGSYFSNKLTGFSKGLTAMLNIYNENYNTLLTSKAGVQEAINSNKVAETEAGNNNTARAVTAENMKDKVRADLYSTNFTQGIKPFLSETRQYMQDAEKLRLKSEYDIYSAIAKQKYNNDIAAINENYVSSIDEDFLKANEGKSDAAIIQAWLNAHPDKTKEYKALLETPTMDYYKSQAKLYEILAPNIGFLNTSTLAYNYESGGKLTAKDRIKIQKIKDYNAARRLDSKESLKSITKDKEEFGKNYRALSAGTLKMLERTLK